MTFHRERHSVLAGNVANVDTPGYRPRDLKAAPVLQAGGAAMASTDPAHLQAGATGELEGAVLSFSDGGESGADGNTVTMERELAKIDANRVRYHATSELASRRLALLRYAAGDGQGG